MMRAMKTIELSGAALDWAVAKCEFPDALLQDIAVWVQPLPCDDPQDFTFQPSSNWAQGGPIIERERICVTATPSAHWDARTSEYPPRYISGQTPLIAAMRCYVASKLGDEVQIPEELC